MGKPLVIPKWGYFKPSKAAHRGLKRYLKYIAHRENPDHVELAAHEKWTDAGLGSNWRAVYAKLTELKGPYILAHNMLISPAPDLMDLVPDDLKQEVVRELTERTIETWHLARGLSVPEYSFCLHSKDTADEDGLQQVHAHVFVAGTIENSFGERESHRVSRQQVVADAHAVEREDNLHRIANLQMMQILDRTIGMDWRVRRPPDPEPTLDAPPPGLGALLEQIMQTPPPVEPSTPEQADAHRLDLER